MRKKPLVKRHPPTRAPSAFLSTKVVLALLAVCFVMVLLTPIQGETTVWNLLRARWGSGTGETDEVRIDAATNALTTIDYAHHEIHAGSFFFVKSYADIANGANLDLLFAVANTTKWPHFQWTIAGEGELTVSIYEGVSTSVAGGSATPDGTFATPDNANRNSANLAGVGFSTGPTLNGGTLGDEGEGGTLVWSGKIASGGKQSAAHADRATSYEFVGKQNTKYWVRINNASGGTLYCDYDINWYEHTDKH